MSPKCRKFEQRIYMPLKKASKAGNGYNMKTI
jgi:hypothetical protein